MHVDDQSAGTSVISGSTLHAWRSGFRVSGLGFMREFPKMRATLFWGPYNPGHQNSPKALYSMVFGPKSLNV